MPQHKITDSELAQSNLKTALAFRIMTLKENKSNTWEDIRAQMDFEYALLMKELKNTIYYPK